MAITTKQWVRLPVALLQDKQFTRSDIIILAMIIDIIDSRESAEISVATLMQKSGLSDRTVRRSTKKLVEHGYIVTKRTGRASKYMIAKEILPPKQRKESASKQYQQEPKQVTPEIKPIDEPEIIEETKPVEEIEPIENFGLNPCMDLDELNEKIDTSKNLTDEKKGWLKFFVNKGWSDRPQIEKLILTKDFLKNHKIKSL